MTAMIAAMPAIAKGKIMKPSLREIMERSFKITSEKSLKKLGALEAWVWVDDEGNRHLSTPGIDGRQMRTLSRDEVASLWLAEDVCSRGAS